MQINPTRTVAATAAVISAAAVGYSLRPSAQQTALAARTPAVEVRTVVIRRTIHIVRHERVRPPVKPAGSALTAAGQLAGATTSRPTAQARTASPLRTSTSKHAAATTQQTATGTTHSAPVTTRTSGSSASGGGNSSSGTGTTKPVRTRTSGSSRGDDGSRDGSDD